MKLDEFDHKIGSEGPFFNCRMQEKKTLNKSQKGRTLFEVKTIG